ncbi:MAG: COQ9 family protein [Pseudomonadota bacterium]
MTDTATPEIHRLVAAALPHVAFDGWSEATFRAAIRDSEVDAATARTLCPRGAVDLALAFHAAGDAAMAAKVAETDMSAMRYRDKVAAAVRFRLEAIEDKEAVRRGVTLFSLPQYAGLGASATWGTVDAIWNALGDTSDDVNWYTKRATLSGVYGATVLYWLGDESPDHRDTWAFLDRRIDNVMQIEKVKSQVRDNPVLKTVFAGPNWLASRIKAPSRTQRTDVPGVVTPAPEA